VVREQMPRILVVDDDLELRQVVTAALAELGLSYDEAGNGREALEKLGEASSEEMYDCILLDIVMPEVDGWQVLEAVKSNPLWTEIPVVVLTGYATSPSDVVQVSKYDGVHMEKKGQFVQTVGALMKRLVNIG